MIISNFNLDYLELAFKIAKAYRPILQSSEVYRPIAKLRTGHVVLLKLITTMSAMAFKVLKFLRIAWFLHQADAPFLNTNKLCTGNGKNLLCSINRT